MRRFYFISDNLDDLESVENELESSGFDTPQIHVLSLNDAEVELHHLHEVEAVLKQDVVHSTEIGAVIGVIGAALVLLIAYFTGVTETAAGWVPFIFLAIVVLGFCTWEGGMRGIQEPHKDFARFKGDLKAGRHVFFVDVDPDQEPALQRVVDMHPQLKPAGTGKSTPRWVVRGQKKFHDIMKSLP